MVAAWSANLEPVRQLAFRIVDDTSRFGGLLRLGNDVMDNMVFRAVGFLDGSAWWTFPTVNYSGASAGYNYAVITLTEMTIILGAF